MKVLAVLLALALVMTPIFASAAPEDYLNDFNEALPDGLKGSLDDVAELGERASFKTVLSEIFEVISSNGKSLISFLLMLISLAVLAALAELADTRLRPAAVTAVSVICAVLIFERIRPLVASTGAALEDATSLFSALVPIFTAITASGGGVGTAAAGATGMSISLGVIGFLSSEVMTYAVFMMFILGMLPDSEGIASGVLRAARSFFGFGIGIICFLLGATLSLQTVIASASDGMLIRSAKFTISSSIPIVGGAVSGALSTLAAGLSYAKGIVGGGSIVAVVAITLSPIVLLLAYRLILSIATSFVNFLGTGGGVRAFSAMLGALDSLIGVVVMSTIVYIFEIIIFIKSGVAIL